MFTSVERKHSKVAFVYLILSIFCVMFGWVYEQYSHGVYAEAMIYAFVYPLCLGCLPFFLLSLWGKVPVKLPEKSFFHPGVATLTVGSIVQGVLEIYGTTNRLTGLYAIAGWTLVILGVLIYAVRWIFLYCKGV